MNSRLDELQAAILRVSLRASAGVDRAPARARRVLPARARGHRPRRCREEQEYATAVYHLFVVRHPRRDALDAGAARGGRRDARPLPDPAPPAAGVRAVRGRPRRLPVVERAACRDPLAPALPRAARRAGGRGRGGRAKGGPCRPVLASQNGMQRTSRRPPEEDRRPHRAGRHHRPRLRRPPARPRSSRRRGFPVVGFDVDPKKPEALAPGRVATSATSAPSASPRRSRRGRIAATTDFARLAECDAILICVPTPLGKHREPDLSYIQKTAEAIAADRSAPASSSSSSRRPTRARRARSSCRASRRRASSAGATSSSPSRPSARTRATRASTPRTSRRSSAASTRPRGESPCALYGGAVDEGRAGLEPPRSPRRRSSSRTSSAR